MLDPEKINVGAEEAAAGRSLSIAFGLERIGLIAMRAPILSCIVLVALCVGAFFACSASRSMISLSQPFRSETREYKQYEEVTKRFPRRSSTCWSSSKARPCWSGRTRGEAARSGHRPATGRWHARDRSRCFRHARRRHRGKFPAALFPEKLPEGADYDKFIETVKRQRDHPRQVAVGGRYAGADRAVARAIGGLGARA